MPDWLSQVLQINCSFLPNKIKRNYQKNNKNQNKTALSTEEGSQSDPESNLETKNECDANENEPDPYCVKQDK